MDEIVLRFQCLDNEIDLMIDDVDKVMWIDLINEYEEECVKKKLKMPEFPIFSYDFGQKSNSIDSDKDLMTMLENFSNSKIIYIYVGYGDNLSDCVKTARQLKSSLVDGSASKMPVDDTAVDPLPKIVECDYDLMDRLNNVNDWTTDEALAYIDDHPELQKQLSRKPKKLPLTKKKGKVTTAPNEPQVASQMRTFSNAPRATSDTVIHNETQNQPKHVLHLKKIPKTTASRKGIAMPNSTCSSEMVLVGPVRRKVRNMVPLDGQSDEDVDGNDDEEEVDPELAINCPFETYNPYEDEFWQADVDNDDSYLKKMYKNGEFYEGGEFGKIELRPWMMFSDKEHLKGVLRDYCIQSGFAVVCERSNPRRLTVLCDDFYCPWRLHASILPDGKTWAIKSIQNPEHTCMGLAGRNPMVNVAWAKEKLMNDIRANNDIPGKALNELLWDRYGVQMQPSTIYKTRGEALKVILGGHDTSYSYLPKYVEMVRETNQGSVADCGWIQGHGPEKPLLFSNIFISLKACIDGVRLGCRSLIGVDGCHLKGHFGGVVLSAVAIDANNELFPLAWAIVSCEDEISWKFFVHHLKSILLSCNRGDEWCIISDRQKGIDAALNDLWPQAGRRYCCKHLSKNWKAVFPGPLMYSLFWRACSATSLFTFGKAMKAIQKANPLARVWLSKLGDQSRWSKHAFDPKICNDENKTNFVESFNATLGVDRHRPVLTLLEGIRTLCMVRISKRREKCESWKDDEPCPNVRSRIQKLVIDARTCKAFKSGPGEYDIRDGKSMLPVSLNNRTCICGAWQITGVPCKHAVRAILYEQGDPLRFTSTWYLGSVYKQTYYESIRPIPDSDNWPDFELPNILPPVLKRGVGRPSRNRRKEVGETEKGKRSTTIKCSNCKEWGHNKLTCKGGLTAKEKASKNKATVATSKASNGDTDIPECSKNAGRKRKSSGASSQPEPVTNPSQLSQTEGIGGKKKKTMISASQPLRRSARFL